MSRRQCIYKSLPWDNRGEEDFKMKEVCIDKSVLLTLWYICHIIEVNQRKIGEFRWRNLLLNSMKRRMAITRQKNLYEVWIKR